MNEYQYSAKAFSLSPFSFGKIARDVPLRGNLLMVRWTGNGGRYDIKRQTKSPPVLDNTEGRKRMVWIFAYGGVSVLLSFVTAPLLSFLTPTQAA